MSNIAAGHTLLSSWPSSSGGSVTGGVGGIYQPGYQFSTGFDTVNSAANASAIGGVSYNQLGMGALSIAGGAYGVYSGLQAGGARGYTQTAGGAVGIAGGAASLTVANGATAAGGRWQGPPGPRWRPSPRGRHTAAAIFVASMLMSERSPTTRPPARSSTGIRRDADHEQREGNRCYGRRPRPTGVAGAARHRSGVVAGRQGSGRAGRSASSSASATRARCS